MLLFKLGDHCASNSGFERHLADDPVDLPGNSLFPHVFLGASDNSLGTPEIAG